MEESRGRRDDLDCWFVNARPRGASEPLSEPVAAPTRRSAQTLVSGSLSSPAGVVERGI